MSTRFEGTATHFNFQEALNTAIRAAADAAPGQDMVTKWQLVEVTGKEGGLHAYTEIKVVIEILSQD